jgi:aspartokinase-like uncharacterized kinase
MKPSCVVKVGGSLLDLPDLPARLENFLADFSRPCPVVLVGGGDVVEQIRKWDRAYALGEEASHWIALQALTITAMVLERAAPILERVESRHDLPRVWGRKKVPLYDAHRFIRDVDGHSREPLPRRWRVTSDSIAARMASELGAPEVILLKSVSLEDGLSMEEAARRGFVDPHFPAAAQGLARVVVVNFREEPLREQALSAT